MSTININFQARVQLQNFHHLPVEILRDNSDKPEPLQLPCNFASCIQQPVSATKQAFLDMASAPLLNLEDLDESFNFNDSDPEILLSDSDEEDEEEELIVMADDDEFDADTAIDSADLNQLSDNDSLDEEGIDHMDDFEECTDRNSVVSSSLSNHSSPANKSASAACKRIFIDLPAVEQSASFSSRQQWAGEVTQSFE